MEDSLLKQAKSFFDANPDRDVIYATKDGNFFWEKRHAENHASDIKGEVYEIHRKDLKEEKKQPAGTNDGKVPAAGKDAPKNGKDAPKNGKDAPKNGKDAPKNGKDEKVTDPDKTK